MNTSRFSRSLLLLCALVLSSCASTFTAPNLPAGGEQAIAVLEPKVFERGAKFFITKIDGQARGLGWFNRFELAPGRRAITASVNAYGYRGADITKYFTAEAGKRYHFVVNDDPASMRWTFSIVELATGRPVDSPAP